MGRKKAEWKEMGLLVGLVWVVVAAILTLGGISGRRNLSTLEWAAVAAVFMVGLTLVFYPRLKGQLRRR